MPASFLRASYVTPRLLVKIETSQSEQTSKHLDSQTLVGTSVQVLYAHRDELGEGSLYPLARVQFHATPLLKGIGFHVLPVLCYQLHSMRSLFGRTQSSLGGSTNVALIRVHTRSIR